MLFPFMHKITYLRIIYIVIDYTCHTSYLIHSHGTPTVSYTKFLDSPFTPFQFCQKSSHFKISKSDLTVYNTEQMFLRKQNFVLNFVDEGMAGMVDYTSCQLLLM